MMGARSQRHLSEIMGADSQGEVTDVTTHPNVAAEVLHADATSLYAKICLSGGPWDTTVKVRANITAEGVAAASYDYTPSGVETPTQVATGLAAVINADARLSSTGSSSYVSVLAVAPATYADINYVQILAA
jgi:hypothetical protein